MCGRFVLNASAEQLQLLFEVGDVPQIEPRYNIAPTQPVAIVRMTESGKREFAHVLWGLIPSWAKDPSIANKLINARSEGVTEKPSFRNAFKRRRCLVPASGFYEWKKNGSSKEPWFITMESGDPFAIAGLWEIWNAPDGGQLETCTLLTTEPNELAAKLHNRMPVIIARDDYALWLGSGKEDHKEYLAEVHHLMRPFPAEEMTAWPVGSKVGNPRNEGAELMKSTKVQF